MFKKHFAIVALAAWVMAAAWLFIQPEPELAGQLDLGVVPLETKAWEGKEAKLEGIPIEDQLAPQALTIRDYENGRDPYVNLCLVYNYARRSRSFHDPWVCFPAQGFALRDRGTHLVDINGEKVPANLLEASKNAEDFLVAYWYLSGNKPIEFKGERQGDLRTAIMSRLKRTVGVSSMVRVSTPMRGDPEEAMKRMQVFLEEFYPHIKSVKADLKQSPMPAAKMWQAGLPGRAGMLALLIVPLALAVVSWPGNGRNGNSNRP